MFYIFFVLLSEEGVDAYLSCKDAFEKGLVVDGVYNLDIGPHFCVMSSVTGCGGGGWTLAMKIDGSKVTIVFLH